MLSEEQKTRVRYHLGYELASAVSTFNQGIPAPIRTSYMLEGGINKLLPGCENIVVENLCRADDVLRHVYGTLDLNDVSKTGVVEVDPNRLRKLSQMYNLAIEAIANVLGCIPNPFDQRSWVQLGRGGVNCGVSG